MMDSPSKETLNVSGLAPGRRVDDEAADSSSRRSLEDCEACGRPPVVDGRLSVRGELQASTGDP